MASPIDPDDYMKQSAAIAVNDDIKAFILLKEEKDTIFVSYSIDKVI